MKVKILYFAGGILLGGLAGFFGGKKLAEKQAEKRADEEIEKMRRYYERKSECKCSNGQCGEIHDGDDSCDKDISERSGDDPNETVSGKNRTDYTKYYKPGSAKTDLVFEDGCDPTAEYEGSDEDEQELEEAAAQVVQEDYERKLNKNRKPKIISAEAVDELPPYVVQELLYYYPETDIMIDEDDHLIDEYGYLVGDSLEKYGFGDEDNDERVIFVRNFDLDTCYEIQKMPGNDPITEAALE